MRHVLVQGLVSMRTNGSWAVGAGIHPLFLAFYSCTISRLFFCWITLLFVCHY